MSRARNFLHAVWSGYLLTIVTSLLNLLTIPIALAVLGKPAFGLWSAILQVTTFTGVFDMGFGPSLGRFITDYKDHSDRRAFASFLKSVFFVGALQGCLFSVAILALISYLPGLMDIPAQQSREFIVLLLLHMGTTALGFPLRPFSQLLYAHQQLTRLNACSLVSTLGYTGVLLLGLFLGWGIYSYIAATWTLFVLMQGGVIFFVLKLRLLPSLRHAPITLRALKPLALFSGDVFVVMLGLQLIALAPTLLITRKLGLLALADWTIGTRLVLLAWQLIGRITNACEPVFWEMYTRLELERLRQRLQDLVLLAGSVAAFFGAGIVAVNSPFISLWTANRVHWLTVNDIVLVLWVVLLTSATVSNMVPGMTKRVGSMKYVFLLEGVILAGLAYVPGLTLQTLWQVALCLLLGVGLFRLPYGIWRTWRDLQIPGTVLASALGRTGSISLLLLALALTLRWATESLPSLSQLLINGTVYSLLALPAVYLVSLPSEPRQRIREWLQPLLAR